MIAAVALTVAAAGLVGAVEYARIRVVRARFARAVHAQRRAVPPGEVPPSPGVTVAGRASVSPMARPALFGPAGPLHHTSGRPGHHDGPGAA